LLGVLLPLVFISATKKKKKKALEFSKQGGTGTCLHVKLWMGNNCGNAFVSKLVLSFHT